MSACFSSEFPCNSGTLQGLLMWALCKLSKHSPSSQPWVSLLFLCVHSSSFLPASSQPCLCSLLFHGAKCFLCVSLVYTSFFKGCGGCWTRDYVPDNQSMSIIHCKLVLLYYLYKTWLRGVAWLWELLVGGQILTNSHALALGCVCWELPAELGPCLSCAGLSETPV